MNLLESKMVDAIKNSTSVDLGNTRVEVFGETVKVYLFNRLIADIDYTYMIDPVCESDGRLIVSIDSLNPIQTSRLNAILDAFGKPNLRIRRYEYDYINNYVKQKFHTFYGLEK